MRTSPTLTDQSLGAYEVYACGCCYWHRLEKVGFYRARELDARAIALPPGYPAALAGQALDGLSRCRGHPEILERTRRLVESREKFDFS